MSQYKKNRALHKIKKATPKLRTDNTENVLGDVKGNRYDNKRRIAKTAFIK